MYVTGASFCSQVGHGPAVLAVGEGFGVSFFRVCLSGLNRCGLKYCLKGPFNYKQSINCDSLQAVYVIDFQCSNMVH